MAAEVAEGRVIERVRCADDRIVIEGVAPRTLARTLTGRHVVAVHRYGKQLWFELDSPPMPLFHYGMTGAFHVPGSEHLPLEAGIDPGNQWPPRFWKIQLEFNDGGRLAMTSARRLGRIRLRQDPMHEPPLSKLGFDPLLNMPTPTAFAHLIEGRRVTLKGLLLNQSFAAGVGNWIADEVLFQAGLDPPPHRRLAGRNRDPRSPAVPGKGHPHRGAGECRQESVPQDMAVPPSMGS